MPQREDENPGGTTLGGTRCHGDAQSGSDQLRGGGGGGAWVIYK
jgi:hypothetical protein